MTAPASPSRVTAPGTSHALGPVEIALPQPPSFNLEVAERLRKAADLLARHKASYSAFLPFTAQPMRMSRGTTIDTPQEVRIGGSLRLGAFLGIPTAGSGLVIFAHGSGSGRSSPPNNHAAARLREHGFATLLLDLLTPEEEQDRRNVFDVGLLAARLRMTADWAQAFPETRSLPPCYFGASTGGGAALRAAAGDTPIAAIVSRGGRPDLAGEQVLAWVKAPTLLIVGERDGDVIELNARAYDKMRCERDIVIIPSAGHLFEEPGTLDQVVQLTGAWFRCHLGGSP